MNWQTGRRRAPIVKVEAAPGLVVGADILAACGKCKARTGHTVIAKVGVKPTRVECTTCKDVHAYKANPTRRPAAASIVNMSPEEAWNVSMKHAQGVARPYSTTGRFEIGARVTHQSFGEGVVARLSSPTVCEVVFLSRTVKLIMAPIATGIDWTGPAEGRMGGLKGRSRRRMG